MRTIAACLIAIVFWSGAVPRADAEAAGAITALSNVEVVVKDGTVYKDSKAEPRTTTSSSRRH